MHEKTLLYVALGVTAAAASFGVYKARAEGPRTDIAPVTMIDSSSKGITNAEVPIKLTSSDGTGLKLVALKAEAAVEDPLGLTELHLTFENPENRVLEGTFRITLPQGASLSRFAMKVGEVWQEGEVVEKQAARAAYEDFLHRKQDPALMEQGAGNEFSARVFPIPARGKKEIIVTYSEAIEIGAPYVLPLRGLPQLGTLDVNVHVAGKNASATGGKTDATFGIHQTQFTPASDFVVEAKQVPRSPGLRSGDLAITRVIPFSQSRPEPMSSAVILVDTSASRGLGIADQARALRDVLAKLPPDAAITVACFDQDVVPIYEGNARGFGEKELSTIVARGALGASDFEMAIGWAGAEAKKKKANRILFVTDGVATAGETDAQKLKTKVEALRDQGVTRMDAIAIGGIRDDSFLRTVVRGVLDRDGVVLDAKLGADALARRLGEATSSGVAVKVDGARWSYPDKLDGLQAGDEVLVYAELETNRPLSITVGGQPFNPDLRTVERPLVERAWAQAKIQSLIEQPKDNATATKAEIIALSTSHRVLSPYTALLVLENDWDYRRFNIDRNAKVDILTVENGKVAVTESGRITRDEAEKRAMAVEKAKKKSEDKSDGFGSGFKGAGAAAEAPAATAAAVAPAPMASAASNADGLAATTTPGGGAPPPPPAAEPSPASARMEEQAPPRRAMQPRAIERDEESARADSNATAPRLGQGLSGLGSGGGGSTRPSVRPSPRPAGPQGIVAADPTATGGEAVGHGRVAGPTATVRPTTLTVDHGMSSDEAQRVIRGAVPRLRSCYQVALNTDPNIRGSVTIRFTVDPIGEVRSANITAPGTDAFNACISGVAKGLRFPAPGSGDAVFTQAFDLVGGGEGNGNGTPSNIAQALPYEGRFKTVMELLQNNAKDAALDEANRWHADQPGDILSLVALGEVFEAKNEVDQAARAYGSILELFSFRADSRRFAGERLDRLHNAKAQALAADTYGKAAEQRPDHPASHRLHAYALLKKGDPEKAFEAIKKGAMRTYPAGRFRGVDRILKEDMGIIAAVWTKAQPARAAEIKAKLKESGGIEENAPSLRFVLVWETDANDVDFHIHDGKGGHAYYSQMELPSGGNLYADVTTGYGPECFTIRGPRDKRAFPYKLQAHYYSRGPMGYGMGKLEVLEHDGKGGISFDERPFVVMLDRAYVDMGTVDKNTKLTAL